MGMRASWAVSVIASILIFSTVVMMPSIYALVFEDDFNEDDTWIFVGGSEALSDPNIDTNRGLLNYTTVQAGIDTFYVDLNPLLNNNNLTDSNGDGDFRLDVTIQKIKDSTVDDPSCTPCSSTGGGIIHFLISEFPKAHGNLIQDSIGFKWRDINSNPCFAPSFNDQIILGVTDTNGRGLSEQRPNAAFDAFNFIDVSNTDGTSFGKVFFRMERIGSTVTVKTYTDESRTVLDAISMAYNLVSEIPEDLRYLTITDQGTGGDKSQQRFDIFRIELTALSNQELDIDGDGISDEIEEVLPGGNTILTNCFPSTSKPVIVISPVP